MTNGGIADTVRAAVKDTLEEESRRNEDPYRTALHYLAGLLAFCLAVIAAAFAALPKDPAFMGTPAYRMLGGALAWISVTALAAALAIAVVQIMKRNYRLEMRDWRPGRPFPAFGGNWLILLMVGPTGLGAGAVYYCLRGGAAMLTGAPALPSFPEALRMLVPF